MGREGLGWPFRRRFGLRRAEDVRLALIAREQSSGQQDLEGERVQRDHGEGHAADRSS